MRRSISNQKFIRIGSCKKFVEDITKIGGVSIQNINKLAEKHGIFGQRSLKDKLFQDCLSVQKLGTTNDELADHLNAILHDKQWANGFQISYNPALLSNSTIGKYSQAQLLQNNSPVPTCCPDHCFRQPNIFNEKILCRQRIENLQSKVYLSVTDKIIARIREGYYDGFNPIDVVALLTGHTVNAMNQAIGIGTPNNEINNVLSSIAVER